MEISISGIDAVVKKLEEVKNNAYQELKDEISKQTELIATDARSLCPVDTGHLRESIQTRIVENKNEITGEVFTDIEYAPYVEFGTGQRGEKAGLKREGINLAYSPDWAGMDPHPFMYPALEAHRDDIMEKLKAAVVMELK
ncbi:MAG: HK97 gp10 family phage protein [Lachnospiraceae bacterium]|nr:HK97 gp10 family phage protein [Lachnospiraceae bacterium]